MLAGIQPSFIGLPLPLALIAWEVIVTRRTCLSVAAACTLIAGLGWLAAASEVKAQGSCRSTCWEQYGACYKSTANRQRCQAQLQRCLHGCMRSNGR
jgi:hypothetical protein